MGNAKFIIGGLLITGAFIIPVYRSGGRTNLTWFEWVMEHTIWGSPIQYVPEEDYTRELEGVKTVSLQKVIKGLELREEGAMYSGTTVAEMNDALTQMEDSINFGQKATLQIVSEVMPTRQELDEAYVQSRANGLHLSRYRTKVVNGRSVTEVTLIKGSPVWWTALIIPVAIIVGMIVFGVMGERITKALVPILLIVGGSAVAIAIASKGKVEIRRG